MSFRIPWVRLLLAVILGLALFQVLTVSQALLSALGGVVLVVIVRRLILKALAPNFLSVCQVRVGDRPLLAYAGAQWAIRVGDPDSGEVVTFLKGHRGWVNALCELEVEGRVLLASGGDDQSVRLWDPSTGEQVSRLKGSGSAVLSVCQVRVGEGVMLAAGGRDGTVRVWEPISGESTKVMSPKAGEVLAVCAVEVDGREMIASGHADKTVRLWDPNTGEELRVLTGHDGFATALCQVRTAGGTLLASAGTDAKARLWNPATGEQLHVMEDDFTVMGDDFSALHALCEIRVGERNLLASAGDGPGVKLWDPTTGTQVGEVGGATFLFGPFGCGWVRALCPIQVGDELRIATGGYDKRVQTWVLSQ
ncbi:WD40 repeat domain-containing protein [Streptomyces albipurpureus]|uniref:WD40 repeat domain-containing protein n=1 Tax=Streptomyces albipurpureus TaxID=2897419 RepID=A0ABT0UWY3_9ACTN|nr:WD40 repeat domain-containing protein [Streptomyces sp. CWNU-1]MCM2392155.1 WD40 repeat domain-containing protein [Streptomyces sp. CWNU-1]